MKHKGGFVQSKAQTLRMKSYPPRTQKGGGVSQSKYNASSKGQNFPLTRVPLRKQNHHIIVTHWGFAQFYTMVFYLTPQHKNYIGPSPIHSDITTDSSSSNIMRSTSSMTSRTVMSKISSASLRRYALNLGPAINDGSHQSSCTKASSSFYMKQ